MGLKKFYYSLENKWYDFVEKTGLYKITDKIDKFMPSFIFFILLVIMLIAGLFLLLPTITGGGNVSITFRVIDDSGEVAPLAPIGISTIDDYFTVITNEDGETEKVKIPKDTDYTVTIDSADSKYETFTGDYVADESGEVLITLTEIPPIVNATYTFTIIDSVTRQKINANGTIEFACANSNLGKIAPATATINNGSVSVTADSSCQLKATAILVPGYQARRDGVSITSGTLTIDLQREFGSLAGVHTVNFTVQGEGSSAISGIYISLYANNIAVPGLTCTTTAGVCSISGIDAGNYTVRATDTRASPEYTVTERQILVSGNASETIILTRAQSAGYIFIKVKKPNGLPVVGAKVKLKFGDQDVITGYLTDSNGQATLPVYNLERKYSVVVDKEEYMIYRLNNVTASATMPSTPIIITLQLITPDTAALLKIRVLNSDTGKGFNHAQVVLYDVETGFLTDYEPVFTNADGNCSIRVTNGNYYARAFKGASSGRSDDINFNVRNAADMEPLLVPMEIVRGSLLVSVVDNYGDPVPRANIKLYDKYSEGTLIWGGDLANTDGTYEISDLISDTDVYAVVEDVMDNLGMTQSEYVYINPNMTNELKVTLYPKQSSLQKPEIKFLGFFNDSGEKLIGYLRSGAEYKARFLLLVPQDRDGDEEFQEVGAVIRTGTPGSVATPYMENDSIYIKSIDLPNTASITKYTQYSPTGTYDSISDVDTLTEGDAKWAKVVFNEVYRDNYANAYTIMANIKIKDEAVYGETVSVNYLGFGYNDNDIYETDPIDETTNDETNNDDVEYMTYKTENFNIGEEQACSDDFCFTLNILNLDEDLREDVVDNYTASPNQHYKLRFGLINNSNDKIYSYNSRLDIKNEDKGLNFTHLKIVQPSGALTNQDTTVNVSEYSIPVEQFNPHTTISGEIDFIPVLKGDRQFVLTFVSDQRPIFTRLVVIHVLSDKTFTVKVTPEVIPSGRNFNLQVDVKDATTGIEVENPVTVRVKDRFKHDLISPVQVGALGIASVNNIPGQNSGDKIYVYVEAPEYETSVTEIEVTENIFKLIPTKLGVSLNINTKPTDTAKFVIENLSESELIIDSIVLVGDNEQIDSIDVTRVNNSLLSYSGTAIPGIDSSDRPEASNYNNKQEIEAMFFTSPRAESLTQVRNIPSKLIIKLTDKYNKEYVWVAELPTTITVGYDGLMDNPNCITLSEGVWETTVIDNYVDKQFTLKNNCGVKERPVPLNGGLSAKVEFEGSPLGVFTASVGNRNVELSHGYYKTIYDTVDSEKQYIVNLRYAPVGRYTGDIKGKIIFRSINATSSGNQELITEYQFIMHVVSLKDCYTVSKKVLTVPDTGTPDSFIIENKGCGSEIIYRLSCDQCTGLVLSPKEDIRVGATGTSEEIKVMSMGAMPGIYLLNIYSKVGGARGSERNVGKIRVEVRPVSQCLDLDRYEYDLFRYQYTENTGREVQAKSYDTGNLINKCYGQEVKVKGTISDKAKWQASIWNGLRDGVLVGGISLLTKTLSNVFSPNITALEKATGLDSKVITSIWNKIDKLDNINLVHSELVNILGNNNTNIIKFESQWCKDKGCKPTGCNIYDSCKTSNNNSATSTEVNPNASNQDIIDLLNEIKKEDDEATIKK